MELITLKNEDFILKDGHYWMTTETLGLKLEILHPRKSINKLYSRNAEELKPFAGDVILTSPGGKQKMRVFNEWGCYVVAMLAKTPIAAALRKDIAQILKRMRNQEFDYRKINLEYQKRLSYIAKNDLNRLIKKNRKFSKEKMELLIKLKPMLKEDDLARAFGIGARTISNYMKLHRESQGDFRNLTPANFKMLPEAMKRRVL